MKISLQALKISGEENLEALRRRLRAMERDGQLVLLDVSVMPYLNASIFGKVKLSVTMTAMVLRAEGQKDDLYLSQDEMKKTMHGDVI